MHTRCKDATDANRCKQIYICGIKISRGVRELGKNCLKMLLKGEIMKNCGETL